MRFVVIKSCPKGFRKPFLERILVDKEFLGFSEKRRDVIDVFFWQLTSDIYWGCPPPSKSDDHDDIICLVEDSYKPSFATVSG